MQKKGDESLFSLANQVYNRFSAFNVKKLLSNNPHTIFIKKKQCSNALF
jgi:hypothetical protein